MQGQISPKVVGATVIGFALVGGAYTVSTFGVPPPATQPATTQAANQPRVAITVTDNDNNGIEDWRDEFVTSKPVVLDTAAGTDYTPPDTLTGQVGVEFMQDVIRSRGYGPFGSSDEEVIQRTVTSLEQQTEQTLYDTPDITIMEEWGDDDIVNYANTVAATLYRYSNPDLAFELDILQDILRSNDDARMDELRAIRDVYRGYRDDTLQIPVPAFLVKEHLDLINSYHAIYEDIGAMTKTLEDPAVALLRLKRYQDDATGLGLALQNMYLALETHANLFTVDDPAALFVLFSPDLNI